MYNTAEWFNQKVMSEFVKMNKFFLTGGKYLFLRNMALKTRLSFDAFLTKKKHTQTSLIKCTKISSNFNYNKSCRKQELKYLRTHVFK